MTDGGPTSSRRQRGRHSERSRVSLLKPAAPAVPAAADKQHNDNYDDEKRGGYPYPCRTPPGGALRRKGPVPGQRGESEQGRPAPIRNTDEARPVQKTTPPPERIYCSAALCNNLALKYSSLNSSASWMP